MGTNYDSIINQMQDDQQALGTAPKPVAPAQPAAANPYDKAIDTVISQDQDARAQASLALSFSADSNPDKAAINARIAKRYNTTPDVVDRYPEEFKQRMAIETARSALTKAPTLQSALNQNPATAQVMHDDVQNAAGVEQAASALNPVRKTWGEALAGAPYAALQGLGASFNNLAAGVNTGLGAIPAAVDVLTGGSAASDWWRRNMIEPRLQAREALAPGHDASFTEKAASTAGSLLGIMSQIVLSGGGGAAAPAVTAEQTTAQAVGTQLAHGARSMALPAFSDAMNTGRDVYDQTGDWQQAVRAAQAQYAASTAMGALPMAAPGNLLTRVGSGALWGALSGELNRKGMNAVLPPSMQQSYNPEDSALNALAGAAFGVMGPRGENARVQEAVRKTYTDAAQAEAATRDMQTLQTLSQLSSASKWRERDPEGFRQFVSRVAEDGPVDHLYVDGRAFMQSMDKAGVTPDQLRAQLPDVAAQLKEVAETNGDVRIPLADYATHIAGSRMDSDLLPLLKTDPEGKTYQEAQTFYQEQAGRMQEMASKLVHDEMERGAFRASQDAVQAKIQQQLDQVGRFSPQVNKIYAGIQSAILSRIAAHEGITPEQAHEKYGANVTAQGFGGLDQAPRTLADVQSAWDSAGVKHAMSEKDGVIRLSQIVVPEGQRGQGVGTQAMRDLIAYADQTGQRIALTPSADFGGTKSRLTKFYKDLGFTENKGRLRDNSISETMIREPQKPLDQGAIRLDDILNGEPVSAEGVQNNASGESAASLEAQSRLASENEQGRLRVKVDKYGNVTPLRTVDGVDTRAYAGEHILQRGVGEKEWTVLDRGEGAREDSTARAVEAARKFAETFQQDTTGARGFYNPADRTVGLLEKADLSTYLHETGHWALDTYARIADREGAPPAIREEMDRILKWFGVESVEKWNKMTLDEQRPYHEQFARAFEAYLFEGKAPSLELQGAFARIKSWMLNVYQTIRALNVDLTPEVRGVFDRMLASEDAIREAETARVFEPLFKEKPEHMSDAQWGEYLQLGSKATNDAISEMQGKSLRDMKWLSNARSKAIREMQREARAARKEVREQVEREVDQQPVYKAERWIKSGELTDEKGEVTTKLDAEARKAAKINTDALKEMYPESMLGRPDLERIKGLTSPHGMHPDMIADIFGFESGDAMVRALADREPRQSVIEGLTDRRMLEEHGELSSPDAIERAADAAVHNEARAKFMARGLEILLKTKGAGNLLARGAREAAEAAIAARKVGEVNPRQYLAAEARANREAIQLAPKDPAGAVAAQRAALLNNALVRAAQSAVDDVREAIAYAKSFDKRAKRLKIEPEERDMIDNLLARFDFRQVPTEGPSKKQLQLAQWAESQKALGYTPVENPDMLNEAVRMHYKDMTVEQLRGLMDTVKAVERIGRERQRITVDGKRMDIAEAVAPIVENMKARGEKFTDQELADRPRLGVDPLWRVTLDRLGSWLRAGLSEITRPDYKANKYDQHQLLGPFQKAFSERLIGAQYQFGDFMDTLAQMKRSRMAEYGLDKTWQKSLNDIVSNHQLLDNSLETPVKRRLTRGDLIGIAMHVGNESNFDKLARGMGWAPESIWQTLHDNMREKDWNAAKLLGEMAGSRWEEMAAMNRRLGNDTPDKIEPRPFPTKYGEMPGWYAPIRYDPVRSKLARKQADARAVNPQEGLFSANYYRADTTTNGSLNSRMAGYYDFLDLDWRPIEKAITDTMRDLAYREALIDVHKLYVNGDFRRQFQRTYGPEEYKHLGDWLGRLVNSDVGEEKQSKLTAISAASRRALVANGVAFRISTMLKHGGSAGFKSMGYFAGGGEKYFASRVADMATNYSNQVDEALAKFPEIRQRLRQQDRDFSNAVQSIFEPESVHGKAERFGHAGVAWLDFFTAVPTAHAAYDWAVTEGIPKRLGGTGQPMSEADAIKFASKVVREAHGSTNEASQSLLINNRSEIVKNLTILHGFMNNAFGQSADALDKVLHAQGFGKPELLARTMMAQIAPAIMAGWVTFGGPNKDESWLGWAFHHIGGEFAGMLPMVREAWSAIVEGRESAGMPPWIRALTDTHKAIKSVAQGEKAKHPIKDVGNAAGLLLPGLGQAGATGQFLYNVGKGDDHPTTVGEWLRGIMSGKSQTH